MIVLDTHVAVWLLADPSKLTETARQAIRHGIEQGQRVGCSVVSLYEIANAVRRQRLGLNYPVGEFLEAMQSKLAIIPLTPEIAIAAAQLAKPMHGDPLDRIIAATAVVENCTLITADRKLLESGVCKTLW
jgi:PIN domain nuclease of toxin-antitoxin system